MAVSQREDS